MERDKNGQIILTCEHVRQITVQPIKINDLHPGYEVFFSDFGYVIEENSHARGSFRDYIEKALKGEIDRHYCRGKLQDISIDWYEGKGSEFEEFAVHGILKISPKYISEALCRAVQQMLIDEFGFSFTGPKIDTLQLQLELLGEGATDSYLRRSIEESIRKIESAMEE